MLCFLRIQFRSIVLRHYDGSFAQDIEEIETQKDISTRIKELNRVAYSCLPVHVAIKNYKFVLQDGSHRTTPCVPEVLRRMPFKIELKAAVTDCILQQ